MSLQAQLVTRQVTPKGFELDIELNIPPGKTVALLGPNGAGKSTAVSLLAGLRSLDEGRIALGGRVLDDPKAGIFVAPEDRSVGVVFQDYVLFPHLTVAKNVAFGAPQGANVEALLEQLGIAGQAALKPDQLSGGQAQRVALARALITAPDLLLLDEPLSALDVTTRSEARRTLADHLDAFAGPRLLITHDPAEAFLLADEIQVMENGRITQVGSSEDIRLRPRTAYVADLAGANLVRGEATDGTVLVGDHPVQVADRNLTGPALLTIAPNAISLHQNQPEGSPRNAWRTTVAQLEHYGDRVRIQTGTPLSLTAEVTPRAVEALGLHRGSDVWISIKATEIGVEAG